VHGEPPELPKKFRESESGTFAGAMLNRREIKVDVWSPSVKTDRGSWSRKMAQGQWKSTHGDRPFVFSVLRNSREFSIRELILSFSP